MEIYHGSNRIVLAFPLLGIAIKIARIKPKEAWRSFWYDLKGYFEGRYAFSGVVKCLYYQIFEFQAEGADTIKRALFLGILDNIREFILFWKTRNPFLQPTWFSLFGLINIQTYGRPCDASYGDLYDIMYHLSERAIAEDGHHFNKASNFTLHNGHLRILDYGGILIKDIIIRHGQKFWEEIKL